MSGELESGPNRQSNKHGSNKHELASSQPFGAGLPTTPNVKETAEFAREFRRAFSYFLESEGQTLEEFQLFCTAVEYAQLLINEKHPGVPQEVVEDLTRDFVIELLHMERLPYAALFFANIPGSTDLRDKDDAIQAAAEYALNSGVRYGNLAGLNTIFEHVLPHYVGTDAFRESLSARLKECLLRDDLEELTKIRGLIDGFDEAGELPAGFRGQIAIENRIEAESAFVRNIADLEVDLVRQMFWLDEFIKEPEAQTALAGALQEALLNEDIALAGNLISRYSMSRDSLKIEQVVAKHAATKEKAKIAAGYFEELSDAELNRNHIDPLNQVIRFFDLAGDLLEPRRTQKAA